MINTVQVELRFVGLSASDKEMWRITDPRILLAAQRVLLERTGVLSADLLPWREMPGLLQPRLIFVVALDDRSGTGSMDITTLMSMLEEPAKIRVVFSEDSGWKTRLVDIAFEVTG